MLIKNIIKFSLIHLSILLIFNLVFYKFYSWVELRIFTPTLILLNLGLIASQTKKYLDAGVSFNYYMVHGGTNFGFTSGANYNEEKDIQPDITSYDYDAPISEAGWATPKFMAIREVMQKYSKTKLAPIPEKIPVTKYPNQLIKSNMDVLSWIKKEKPVVNDQPLTFEKLGQGTILENYSVWLNVPFSMILTWVFITLDTVGESSMNPFEGSANDVPITQISRTIEIDMRDMLNEENLPLPITPKNNILL